MQAEIAAFLEEKEKEREKHTSISPTAGGGTLNPKAKTNTPKTLLKNVFSKRNKESGQ